MNDLRTAKTLIPRKQSCSKYATVNGFIFTDTPRAERIPKRLFFFLTCRWQATSKTTKVLAQRARGSRETLFFFSFYLFIPFILLNLFN